MFFGILLCNEFFAILIHDILHEIFSSRDSAASVDIKMQCVVMHQINVLLLVPQVNEFVNWHGLDISALGVENGIDDGLGSSFTVVSLDVV